MAFDEKIFLAELDALSDEDIRKMLPRLREKRLGVAEELLRQRSQYRSDNPPWHQTLWGKAIIVVASGSAIGLIVAGTVYLVGWS